MKTPKRKEPDAETKGAPQKLRLRRLPTDATAQDAPPAPALTHHTRPAVRRGDHRRAYRRAHPLTFWLALGVAVVGVVALVFPATVEQTATSAALPAWLRSLFDVIYAGGGAASAFGVHRARRDFEAAGLSLLAGALAAQFAAVVYVRPAGAPPATFILTLAIGCALRARHLTSGDAG